MQIQSDRHQPSGSWQVRDSPANPAQKQICDVCDKLRQFNQQNPTFCQCQAWGEGGSAGAGKGGSCSASPPIPQGFFRCPNDSSVSQRLNLSCWEVFPIFPGFFHFPCVKQYLWAKLLRTLSPGSRMRTSVCYCQIHVTCVPRHRIQSRLTNLNIALLLLPMINTKMIRSKSHRTSVSLD